jgi:hypothetical protein
MAIELSPSARAAVLDAIKKQLDKGPVAVPSGHGHGYYLYMKKAVEARNASDTESLKAALIGIDDGPRPPYSDSELSKKLGISEENLRDLKAGSGRCSAGQPELQSLRPPFAEPEPWLRTQSQNRPERPKVQPIFQELDYAVIERRIQDILRVKADFEREHEGILVTNDVGRLNHYSNARIDDSRTVDGVTWYVVRVESDTTVWWGRSCSGKAEVCCPPLPGRPKNDPYSQPTKSYTKKAWVKYPMKQAEQQSKTAPKEYEYPTLMVHDEVFYQGDDAPDAAAYAVQQMAKKEIGDKIFKIDSDAISSITWEQTLNRWSRT